MWYLTIVDRGSCRYARFEKDEVTTVTPQLGSFALGLAAFGSRYRPRREESMVLKLVVDQRELLADGVVALTLAPSMVGVELPMWRPGAHVDVVLSNGLVRQYSLCGDPAERGSWRIAVLKEAAGRGGSTFVHERLQPGELVTVRGPRNHFALESADRYVFVAGGIGITPILPMIAAAEASGAEWCLTYGGRARSSMAFVDELCRYGDAVVVCPQDEVGLLDLDKAIGRPRPDTLIYCCGPEPLVKAVTAQCEQWPGDILRVERFGPVARVDCETSGDEPISIELRRSGVTVTVPVGTSVLEAVNAAGANVMSSCEEGLCGTCETVVLEGVPDHRDAVLTAVERESGSCMMLCVSRSRTTYLVLDI